MHEQDEFFGRGQPSTLPSMFSVHHGAESGLDQLSIVPLCSLIVRLLVRREVLCS
jgi:hypothetical protein